MSEETQINSEEVKKEVMEYLEGEKDASITHPDYSVKNLDITVTFRLRNFEHILTRIENDYDKLPQWFGDELQHQALARTIGKRLFEKEFNLSASSISTEVSTRKSNSDYYVTIVY